MTRRGRRLVALLVLAALTLAARRALGSSVSSDSSHWEDATPEFTTTDATSLWVEETSNGGREICVPGLQRCATAPMQIRAQPRREPHWEPEDAQSFHEANWEFGSDRTRSADTEESIEGRWLHSNFESEEPICAAAAPPAETPVARMLRRLKSVLGGKGVTALADQANMHVTGRWVRLEELEQMDILTPVNLRQAVEGSLFGVANSTCREIEGHTRNPTKQAESDAQCLRLFTAAFVSELAPVDEPEKALEQRAMNVEHLLFQRFPRVLVVLAHRPTLSRAVAKFRVNRHLNGGAFLPVALRHLEAASEGRDDALADSWVQRVVAATRRVISRMKRRTVLSSRSVVEALTVFTRQYYTNPHLEKHFNATVSGLHRPLNGKRWATRALSAATRSRRVREALFARIVHEEIRPTLMRLLRTAAAELESFDMQNVVDARALLAAGYGIGGENLPETVRGLLEDGFRLYFAHADFVIKRDMLLSVLVIPEKMPSTEAVLCAAANAAGPLLQKVLQLMVRYVKDDRLRAKLQNLFDRIRPLPTREMQQVVNAAFANEPVSTPELGKILGSASIAQVHRARWHHAGKDRVVVVKIRRPNVKERVAAELRVADLLLERRPKLRDYLAQMKESVLRELDFELEARNWEVGHALYARPKMGLYVPRCHMAVPRESPNVLILNRAYGETVAQMLSSREGDKEPTSDEVPTREELNVLARRLETLTERWFEEALYGSGRFHGDPHPGNMMFRFAKQKSPLSLIDFGHMHELDTHAQRGILLFAMGVQGRSAPIIIEVIAGFGQLVENSKLERLKKAVHRRLSAGVGDDGDMDGKRAQSVTAITVDLIDLMDSEGLLLPDGVMSFMRARAMLEQTLVQLGRQCPECHVAEPEDVYRAVALRHWQTYRLALPRTHHIVNQDLLRVARARFQRAQLRSVGQITKRVTLCAKDTRQCDLSLAEHLNLTRDAHWTKSDYEPSALAIAEHAAAVSGNGDASIEELQRHAGKRAAFLPPEPEIMGTYQEPSVLLGLRATPPPRVTDSNYVPWLTEQRMRKVRKPRAQMPPEFFQVENVDAGSWALYENGALYCIRDTDGSRYYLDKNHDRVVVAIDHVGALLGDSRLPARLRQYPAYIDKKTIASIEAGNRTALSSAPRWALPRESPRANEKSLVDCIAPHVRRQRVSGFADPESAGVSEKDLIADIAAERAAAERDLDFSLFSKAGVPESAHALEDRAAQMRRHATDRQARGVQKTSESAFARAASAPVTLLSRIKSLTRVASRDPRDDDDTCVERAALTCGVNRPRPIRGMAEFKRFSRSLKGESVRVGSVEVPVPAFSGTRAVLDQPAPAQLGGSCRELSVLAAAAGMQDESLFEPSSEPPRFLSRTLAAETAKTRAAKLSKWQIPSRVRAGSDS